MAVNKNHPAFIATHTHCDWWPEYVSNDYRKGHEVIFGETDIFKNLSEGKEVTREVTRDYFIERLEDLEENPYNPEEYEYRKKLEKSHQSKESLEPVSPLMLLSPPKVLGEILADDPNVKTYM